MSHCYENDGTTFLFNSGLDGNVTIIKNGQEMTVAGHTLVALAEEVLGLQPGTKHHKDPSRNTH